jgi:ATP-dependent DNA helicase HFM1/MER3
MMGRAGRPQFDTAATAIIMTTEKNRHRYEMLANGTQLIESHLHNHLPEHLNAEISLQTIADIPLALDWLKSTFFYVRVLKNPRHYNFPAALQADLLGKQLQELCVRKLNALSQGKLIKMTEDSEVQATEAGRLMARFYVAFDTMKNFSAIKGNEDLASLLKVLCRSKGDAALISSWSVVSLFRFPFQSMRKSR